MLDRFHVVTTALLLGVPFGDGARAVATSERCLQASDQLLAKEASFLAEVWVRCTPDSRAIAAILHRIGDHFTFGRIQQFDLR